ncbi:amino acid ABC transporter ATP-binding/permease protein [Companilactobacillus sp.]|jgi:ATP-binding cassette subfamily C protein|uniref:amino acid ABC transporter ATP-binding/permease protein n=1 Tax=Companilactobacillus sp. TaxID=2767905 RepID=UPI0025C2DB7C|nr:ABC transporter ATP-binding protein [Companilactobacillus sp.]MCH4009190.1 ABC transporter ATP-binding protein/permease [Companilactobacillus sp.]MCH4050631.1 ABC transporter ATP-binding protein/permease [Companilactobacillus sp.]MCH4077132.1 ABC transporter ATP-binding protein/permease [Companilactobacillus sp.]MCH4125708.1 ABC transporter ATP-binding protein/permease [Companilactobacillus sp.]MCI1311417.1 ABC transporter ATP-binding protein/permease [Companilactobacillus sp.]
MKLLMRLLKTAGRLNWILLASIIAGLVATFFQIGILWQGFSAFFHPVSALWLWIIVLALVGGVARFGEQYLGHLAAFKILSNMRNMVYQKILKLAPAKLDDARSSDVLKLLAQDIDQIEIFYAHTISPVVLGFLTSIVFVVGFWLVQPYLGIIALVSYLLIGLVYPIWSQRHLTSLTDDLNQADLQEQRLMSDAINGKSELQQYQAVDSHLKQLNNTSKHYWQLERQRSTGQVRNALSMQLTMVVSLILFVVVAKLTNVSLVWALVFPFTFSRVLALGNLPGSLAGGLLAARHVFELLDEKPLVDDEGTETIQTINDFSLKKVSFAYPQRPDDVILDSVNLKVKQGERVGLIGPSGAGKSTIMKLVMRWYAAQQGVVEVNDDDAKSYDLDQLRRTIKYVPQTAQVFNASIRENLTLRDTQITDEKIWEVLGWLDLTDTINSLYKGLDTMISSADQVLSAGEIQRLELARALVRESSLLILDEPTSNLDVVNEALILRTVKVHYHGTVVLVTHRHSSLALCDRVLELREGKLTEVN